MIIKICIDLAGLHTALRSSQLQSHLIIRLSGNGDKITGHVLYSLRDRIAFAVKRIRAVKRIVDICALSLAGHCHIYGACGIAAHYHAFCDSAVRIGLRHFDQRSPFQCYRYLDLIPVNLYRLIIQIICFIFLGNRYISRDQKILRPDRAFVIPFLRHMRQPPLYRK